MVTSGLCLPAKRRADVTRYLISFAAKAMDHIPEADMPVVGRAAHAVLQEAVDAGVWVFGAGMDGSPASIVGTDGQVSDGPAPESLGGFAIVDVPSRDEALRWASKIAVACRCAQEVWQLQPDPEQDLQVEEGRAAKQQA